MAPRRSDTKTALPPSLGPEDLRWKCDPASFSFETTAEIGECPIAVIGQPRAMEALSLGLRVRSDGYNIFVAGEVGTGRATAVRRQLARVERGESAPDDLAYVHNFRDPDEPRLLTFPAGRGTDFRDAMDELVETLRKSLRGLFDSDHYRRRRAATVEEFDVKRKEQLKEFEKEVQTRGFAVVQLQMGPIVRPALMPVVAGNPVDLDQLESLVEEGKFSEEEFERLKVRHGELQSSMEALSKSIRNLEREVRGRLGSLEREVAGPVVDEAFADVREGFPGEEVASYLDEAAKDVLDHLERFREAEDPQEAGSEKDQARAEMRMRMLPYAVNVVVDNKSAKELPVLYETSPSYRNLFGAIERVRETQGEWRTDHTRIKVGSLGRANGGFLVLDALDVLAEPGVWHALKRTLRTRRLEIQSFDPFHVLANLALKPQPIPVDVKVILVGTRQIYRLLYSLDEDFKKIFKVKAELALETALSDDELRNYACFVHKKCEDDSLPPFHRSAVAGVVEYAVRLAGRREKLTTRFKEVADLIREAGYWCTHDSSKVVRDKHVDRAVRERIRRVDLIEDVLQERIADGTVLLDVDGSKVGQVNGLMVLDIGDHTFGLPSRITATTAMGRAGIVNIDREAEMSGAIHTKGVLILTGFLRERFAQDKPLSLSASVCFEQNYAWVDGDSASSAELYAILSSLAGLPVRQGIAVTGSVNQRGEIQPIGGVNEKVEGYFDVCSRIGLTGEQGVLIPAQNLPHLMLRKDVVEASRKKRFHVWAVRTVEEGIEILTGTPAGSRGEDGTFPGTSVFGRVDAALRRLALDLQPFGAADLGFPR